jgi:hypothetical protein
MNRSLCIPTILSILGTITSASAEENPATPKAPAQDKTRAHVAVGVGLFETTSDDIGAMFDIVGLGRVGPFAFGGNLQFGGTVFGFNYFSAAPMAGIFAPTPRWFELGILATVGVRHYENIGRELFSDDPGFRSTLPFAGARGIAAFSFGNENGRFNIGFHGFINGDLVRDTRSYTYEQKNWIVDGVTTEWATHTAGRGHWGGIFAIGGTL